MSKIVIFGSKGMLGHAFLSNNNIKIYKAFSHSEIDISNFDILEKTIEKIKPDIVINCAAYTNVSKAEQEKDKALRANYEGVKNISRVCKDNKVKLIHFSTDYVFDGTKKKDYLETDSPNPINYYGRTKLMGEEVIQKLIDDFIIIRVSWLYGNNGNNFFCSVKNWMQEKEKLDIVSDQIGKTTYTLDVVTATKRLLNSNCKGIYHFTNSGSCSRYEFAKEIKKVLNLDCKLVPVSSDQFPDPVPRPQKTTLSTEKYQKDTETEIPFWKDSLRKYLKNISN